MARARVEPGRLFSTDARFMHPAAFFFDAICIALIYVAWLGMGEFAALGAAPERFVVASGTFAPLAGLGVYFFRIATYVAWLRGNRTPQTIERYLTVFGLVFAFACLFGSGLLTRLYVDAHGYASCGALPTSGHLSSDLLFVKSPAICP